MLFEPLSEAASPESLQYITQHDKSLMDKAALLNTEI